MIYATSNCVSLIDCVVVAFLCFVATLAFRHCVCRQFNSLISCVGCSATDSRFPSTPPVRRIAPTFPFTPQHLQTLCSVSSEREQLILTDSPQSYQ